MFLSLSPSFISVLLLSASLVVAHPAQSPKDALAQLENRAKCNYDNCLRAMTNRPSPATAFCTNWLATTALGTTTITVSATSTIIPIPQTTSIPGGTTTTTSVIPSIYLSTYTQFIKRAIQTPIEDVLAASCTPSPTIDTPARVSSACSCLLATSGTVTFTQTTVTTTLPIATNTDITAYSFTATTTVTSPVAVPTALNIPGTCANLPATYVFNKVTFNTQCGMVYDYSYSGSIDSQTTQSSFKKCIDLCISLGTGEWGCNLVNYWRDTGNCMTLRIGGDDGPNHGVDSTIDRAIRA